MHTIFCVQLCACRLKMLLWRESWKGRVCYECYERSAAYFFADALPIETPDQLSDLHGPETGVLNLPLTVYWGPDHLLPINTDNDVICAYREILWRASAEQLCELINEKHLRRLWQAINPSTRVRTLWETKFPELAHA